MFISKAHKQISTVTILAFVAASTMLMLASPAITTAESAVKVTGTGEANISVWLPTGSVPEDSTITADYIAEKDLPSRVKYPDGTVGQAFTFGIWEGDGKSLAGFSPSIVIRAKYDDDDIPNAVKEDEETLHLHMYNPATKAWHKLCSSVDIHENVVYAAMSFPTPFDKDGSSILAIATDSTPPLDQEIDAQGTTTITIDKSDLVIEVDSFVIEDGTHFAVTLLPKVSDSGDIKLVANPVDVKACQVTDDNPAQDNREVTKFSKPVTAGFEVNSAVESRAGGIEKLTLTSLNDDEWVDIEEVGTRVSRDDDAITTDTRNLGVIGLAAR